MLLFAGLGNPGPRYSGNRHNIGFLAIDEISRRHLFGPWRRRFQGMTAEGEIGGQKVLLLKPETFMNESGNAVQAAQNFYKIPLKDITVFHDELDLAPAKVRVKVGGGNAGHNGLRSISAMCGNDYMRVRLGIGHPGDKNLVHHYVLSDFFKDEHGWVEAVLSAVSDSADLLASGQPDAFQNRVHLDIQSSGKAPTEAPGETPDQETE
ncbi:MAG TPA: aminoacyl-tRNA hydrolase [Xanthobacteraceae bacterium]|jgi:PTH1 family peptidyl-tRNA hydrolase|nr:aminoacyl-tRNA hydrolase [Xanthobacteraceae bacterium]